MALLSLTLGVGDGKRNSSKFYSGWLHFDIRFLTEKFSPFINLPLKMALRVWPFKILSLQVPINVPAPKDSES